MFPDVHCRCRIGDIKVVQGHPNAQIGQICSQLGEAAPTRQGDVDAISHTHPPVVNSGNVFSAKWVRYNIQPTYLIRENHQKQVKMVDKYGQGFEQSSRTRTNFTGSARTHPVEKFQENPAGYIIRRMWFPRINWQNRVKRSERGGRAAFRWKNSPPQLFSVVECYARRLLPICFKSESK